MVTTSVSLTEQENAALADMAQQAGKSRDELLREAIEQYLSRHQSPQRKALMQQARGLWRDRDDLPSLETLRQEWDRPEQV